MKTKLAIVIAAVALSATARIGETPAQCKARYGEPLKVDRGPPLSATFKKNGFVVMAEYHEGRAALLIFAKEKTDILGKPLRISANEVKALLASNGQDRKWIKQEIASLDSQWETEDGGISARLDPVENWLFFMTREHVERKSKEIRKKETDNLSGF